MGDYSLSPITALMKAAEKASQQGKHAAISAFNVNFYTQAAGVLEGLRRADAPAIIQASKGANAFQGGPDKIFYMVTRAMQASDHRLPIALHLDHGNVESGKACADNGYTGIMIDASDKDFPENCAVTRSMVAYAHPRGVGVEGEFGRLYRGVHGVEAQEAAYADPEMVPTFFAETNADALAIAYGTSHGPNKGADMSKLKTTIVRDSYRNMVKMGMNDDHYLVGHGSSTVPSELVAEINRYGGDIQDAHGVPMEKITEGIAFGLRKINIDTDLRLGVTAVARKFFLDNPSAADAETLRSVKQALDADPKLIHPRDYLGGVKPFEILRHPPVESGFQEFVDLMAVIQERIAQHVEFLANSFGEGGLAGKVEKVTVEEMKERYAASDPW